MTVRLPAYLRLRFCCAAMIKMRKFKYYIKNFGCKVNQYDGRILKNSISPLGESVENLSRADVVIVNTCGVTKPAVTKGCRYIKKIKKESPDKDVLAVGCAVHSNQELFNKAGAETASGFKMLDRPDESLESFHGHTRGFLKIQQGCFGSCSYCIVRDLKKPFYIKAPGQAVFEMLKMSNNHPEIVLCGTNLAFYSRSGGSKAELLEELLKKIKDISSSFRWRFSSIPPICLSDNNMYILKQDKKFCRHFHIPVQSASSKILKKMRRPYDLSFLEERMKRAIDILDNVVFSYDVMVGFPGETEEDFAKTLSFLEKHPPVRVHVFRYSDVRNTELNSERVSEKIKRKRMEKIKEVSGALIRKKMLSCIGKIKEVIPENNMIGYTEDYLPVSLKGRSPAEGPVDVIITAVKADKLVGRPVNVCRFEKNANIC